MGEGGAEGVFSCEQGADLGVGQVLSSQEGKGAPGRGLWQSGEGVCPGVKTRVRTSEAY